MHINELQTGQQQRIVLRLKDADQRERMRKFSVFSVQFCPFQKKNHWMVGFPLPEEHTGVILTGE